VSDEAKLAAWVICEKNCSVNVTGIFSLFLLGCRLNDSKSLALAPRL
jgi:hypothetical protein